MWTWLLTSSGVVLQGCDIRGFVWEIYGFALNTWNLIFCEWNWLNLLSCRILCCFMLFEAVLKHFQWVRAAGGVPRGKTPPALTRGKYASKWPHRPRETTKSTTRKQDKSVTQAAKILLLIFNISFTKIKSLDFWLRLTTHFWISSILFNCRTQSSSIELRVIKGNATLFYSLFEGKCANAMFSCHSLLFYWIVLVLFSFAPTACLQKRGMMQIETWKHGSNQCSDPHKSVGNAGNLC